MLSLVILLTVNDCLPSLLVVVVPISVVVVSDFLASLAAVPERYDINPGNIGRIQGDKNEPNPAKAETNTLVSTAIVCRHQLPSNHYYYSSSSNKQTFYVCINTYFQIISKFFPYVITNKTKEDNTAMQTLDQ